MVVLTSLRRAFIRNVKFCLHVARLLLTTAPILAMLVNLDGVKNLFKSFYFVAVNIFYTRGGLIKYFDISGTFNHATMESKAAVEARF